MLILRLAGASVATATIAVSAGAVVDIVLGLGVLIGRTCRAALIAMLAVSLGYVVAAAVVATHLFADLLGSVLKIFPIMLATLFVLAILDER
jgi:ABC-type Co2+ transport system permease subunit